MSVMILGVEHANQLATAAARLGLVRVDDADRVARVLLEENIDAFLLAYWDDPSTYDGWDEVDDDEKEAELVEIAWIRDNHQFQVALDHLLTPVEITSAIDRWTYQVNVIPVRAR